MDTLGAAIQRFEERSAAQYESNFIERCEQQSRANSQERRRRTVEVIQSLRRCGFGRVGAAIGGLSRRLCRIRRFGTAVSADGCENSAEHLLMQSRRLLDVQVVDAAVAGYVYIG